MLLGASAAAFAGNWEVDAGHSRVGFAVRHMMIATVHGTFGKYAGTVALDDGDIGKSKVHIDIDAGSIATQNDKRDSDLKSPLFFDVARFPTITFDSTKVEKRGAHGLSVTGNLTIKGVTKAVVLTVADLSSDVKDPFGAVRRGATATAKIDRKDFGLTWNKPLETGGVVLGDEIALELDVELKKAR
ncbi:MAG TPA: YceI family protein [Polyangia bacterium]|nr:YceI family protein [Polyangia bacterium]